MELGKQVREEGWGPQKHYRSLGDQVTPHSHTSETLPSTSQETTSFWDEAGTTQYLLQLLTERQ